MNRWSFISGCRDSDSRCESWGLNGWCALWKPITQVYCRKTCGFCGQFKDCQLIIIWLQNVKMKVLLSIKVRLTTRSYLFSNRRYGCSVYGRCRCRPLLQKLEEKRGLRIWPWLYVSGMYLWAEMFRYDQYDWGLVLRMEAYHAFGLTSYNMWDVFWMNNVMRS